MIEKELLIKKKREFLIQFKDLLYTLSSFIGAGRGMREALKESKIQLSYIYCEDDYIILALNDLIGELSSENSVDSNVIRNFAQETGLEDVVQFANMFTTCKKTGANLIVAMNKGAEVIGEKISAEDEIKAYLSQKRTEGRLMVTMPFIMVCFLKFSGQGYFDIIYQTLAGKLIMLGCLFAIVIVYISIERIVCIEM